MKKRNGIPHIKAYTKDGVLYVYHRVTNAQLCPKHKFRSPEFFAAYAKEEQKRNLVQSLQIEDTVGSAIRSYKSSANHLLFFPGFDLELRRTMVGYWIGFHRWTKCLFAWSSAASWWTSEQKPLIDIAGSSQTTWFKCAQLSWSTR